MPGVLNWLTTPLNFVDTLFARQAEQGGNLSVVSQTSASFDRIADFFGDKLPPEKWSLVPSLNDVPVEHLYNGQIVRFRGMIQVLIGHEALNLPLLQYQCGIHFVVRAGLDIHALNKPRGWKNKKCKKMSLLTSQPMFIEM